MVSIHKMDDLLDCPERRHPPQLGAGALPGGQQHQLQVESGTAEGASLIFIYLLVYLSGTMQKKHCNRLK